MKFLATNLMKNVEDLYTDNYKPLLKEIKQGEINGEIYHISIHGSEDLILLRLSFIPQFFCRFRA